MDDVLYNKTSSDEKLEEIFTPSNMDYKTKVKNLHNLRARIMNEDPSLQGLLTFVPSNVVPDDHPMFDSVAYTDGDEMFFGDKFFSLNKHFQMAAILHEMLHIVFRHVSRGKKRIHTLYNIACFKPEELIYTTKGLKQIVDLTSKDIVIHGNNITNTIINNYKDDMYNVKAMGCLNTCSTQEHPFYVAKKKYTTVNKSKYEYVYEWVTAKNLDIKKHKLCIPKILDDDNLRVLNLDNYIVNLKRNRIPRCIKLGLPITNDLLYAMGYYLAEGSANNKNLEGFNYSLGPNDLYKKDRLQSYFKSIGYKTSFIKEKNKECNYRLSISSSVLSKAFSDWFGRGCENKQIPYWLLTLPKNLITSFIKGYFDGDGYRSKNKISAWSKSKSLAIGMQLLFAKCDRFLNISFVERNNAGRRIRNHVIENNQKGYLMHYSKCFKNARLLNNHLIKSSSQRWVNTDNHILVPIKNIQTEFYEGKVYNIETDKHEYLVSNLIVHNCDAIINSSIGFEGEQKIGNNNYAYFPKEHVVNLESLYEIYKIPTSEQKPFSSWTSESLYEFLIKKVKEDLEKQVEDQTKESKGKQGDKNNKGSKQASSGAGNNTSSKNKNIDGQSELEKLEKEIEDLQRKLAKKHKMFDGSDIKSKSNKDETTSEIDDFKWTQRFNRAKSQSLNSNKSILGRVNPDVYQPQIPWYIELRKYLVKRCMPTTEVSWQRPARRMSSMSTSKTYLPGIQNKKGLDKMVVIIDTSGSCFNEEELTMFCTEVESIQKQTNVELNLIFADTNVQSEFVVKNDGVALLDKMRKGIVKAAGGGGTDMTVPFAYALKKYRPFLTVILSDGFTPYPKSQDVKKTNLIWVVNTDVEIPKESGRTLYINPK